MSTLLIIYLLGVIFDITVLTIAIIEDKDSTISDLLCTLFISIFSWIAIPSFFIAWITELDFWNKKIHKQ